MRRVLLLVGSLLGLCALLSPRTAPTEVDAGTAIRLDIPGLVQRAELVIEGRVLSQAVHLGAGGLIDTEFEIDVMRTFVGEDLRTRSIRLPGGVLPNGNGLMLPGMPVLSTGEDVLLFLTLPSSSGVRLPVGLSQGKFRVETNLAGQKQVSRSHGALTVLDPNSGALHESIGAELFDYAEVIAEIHAAAMIQHPAGSSPAGTRDE